jgi:hypothetical protein
LLHALEPAARQGRLTVPPADAAAEVLAASSGVILALITDSADEIDLRLSARVRDAILDSITTGGTNRKRTSAKVTVASAAIALNSALADAPPVLSDTEAALLQDWLDRLANE